MKNTLFYMAVFVPVFFIFFLLEKAFNPSFDLFEFWVTTIGCFILMPFTFPFLNGLLKASEEMAEKDFVKDSNGKLVKTMQKERDKLLPCLHTLLEELRETKNGCLEEKLIHKIEKLEKQLMESERMYQSISAKNQDKASEMLESILTTIKDEFDELCNKQDEKSLHGLQKVLLQRKN